ncbi:MAG TPA: hypothetical protein VFO74_02715, partial [Pseudolabrys sp.]|nr:hypothetical protein [Pseudolabrys sp.]
MTVELSFNGRFELTNQDADILIQLRGGALLWQKERLLNLALKAVPSNATKIAWFDCDVILKRSDWADEAKSQLKEFRVIQLSGGAVLWQKERLLNLALKAVPSNVPTIAWLDCDVILERSDWVDEVK